MVKSLTWLMAPRSANVVGGSNDKLGVARMHLQDLTEEH